MKLKAILLITILGVVISVKTTGETLVTSSVNSCNCTLSNFTQNHCDLWGYGAIKWLKENMTNEEGKTYWYGGQEPVVAPFRTAAKVCARSLDAKVDKIHYIVSPGKRTEVVIEYQISDSDSDS